MKKKLLLTLAICVVLFALALTLAACDTDADTGATTTTSGTEDGGSTTTTTTTAKAQYTVTFVADGSVVGTRTYTIGDTSISAPDVPQKAHYNGAWESYILDSGNKTVNAVYTPIEYTVTFVANGVTVDAQSYTILDKNVTAPQVPDAQHFESSAWENYTLDGGNKTVNAVYGTPIEYTVTFVANGETVDTRIYTVENKNITTPNIPSKQHYNGEWENYILNGGNKTVNAVYIPIEYTVTFIANGGIVGTTTYTVEDDSIIEPEVPERLFGYYGKGENSWSSYSLDGGNKTVYARTTANSQADYIFSGSSCYVSGINQIFDGKIEILSDYAGVPVTGIGESAFYGCQDLEAVIFGTGCQLLSIDEFAFANCKNLTSITIPSSVTSIAKRAFYGCDSLTSVSFGENSVLQSVGDGVFYNCSGLTGITMPSCVTTIGKEAFYNCKNLTSVGFDENSQLKSIDKSAFYGCKMLTKITIPSGVTSIGTDAFYGCRKLIEIYNLSTFNIIEGSNEHGGVGCYALNIYNDINTQSKLSKDESGFMIYTDGSEKILVGYVGEETDLTFPNTITRINKYAFYGCDSLLSITIPSSVTTIGDHAFYDCVSLDSVTFGENSKLQDIDKSAFSGCESIESLILPSSLTNICEEAFFGCKKLTSVDFGEKSQLQSIGDSAFFWCSNLASITIPSSVKSIGESAFFECYKLKNVIFKYSLGWYVQDTYLSKTSLSSTDLSDAEKAAEFLRSTYSEYCWKNTIGNAVK